MYSSNTNYAAHTKSFCRRGGGHIWYLCDVVPENIPEQMLCTDEPGFATFNMRLFTTDCRMSVWPFTRRVGVRVRLRMTLLESRNFSLTLDATSTAKRVMQGR